MAKVAKRFYESIIKRKTFLTILLLLFLLAPSQFLILKSGIYPSHDALFHIERIKQFHQAILDKQLPPRLAPGLFDKIGYPLFVVNYQLPYYLAEPLIAVANDPIFAFKTIIGISYILSALFAFFLFKRFGSNTASLLGAILFSYLPYRFANIYARGSFGESVSLVFVPLILLSLFKILNNEKYGILLLSLSVFGLVTSHSVIFLLFSPFFLFYVLILPNFSTRKLLNISVGILWGAALSAFQIVPSVLEKKYLVFDRVLVNLFEGHFINIFQLLRIPREGVNIGTPFQIGIVSSLVVLLGLINLIIRRDKFIIFFLVSLFISSFLVLDYSHWFWENLPLLKYVLYPWRVLSIVILSVAFLSVFVVDSLKHKKIIAALLIFTAISTSRHYFLKPSLLEPNPVTPSTTSQNEYHTIWTNEETFKSRPLIASDVSIVATDLEEYGLNLAVRLKSQNDNFITVRRMYFPGWHASVNGKETAVIEKDGLVTFFVTKGISSVNLGFRETAIRKFADWVTLISFILMVTAGVTRIRFLKMNKSFFGT